MQKSESIKELCAALVLAQGELEHAGKTSKNPHFNSKYADLAEVLDTIRPTLSKHGLAVMQFPAYSAEHGVVVVETVLVHRSGEYVAGSVGVPVTKKDAQGVGSGITYARRYSLAAVVGIAQDDDDGNAASKNDNAKKQTKIKDPDAELEEAIKRIMTSKSDDDMAGVYNSLPAYLAKNDELIQACRNMKASRAA